MTNGRAGRPTTPALRRGTAAALAVCAAGTALLVALLVDPATAAGDQVVRGVAGVLGGLLAVAAAALAVLAVRALRTGPSVLAAAVAVVGGLAAAATRSDLLAEDVPGDLCLLVAALCLATGVAVLFLALDPARPSRRRSLL